MAYTFINGKDLGGFREVLEFAMVPFWPQDVEALANGKGRIMLEVAREKKLIELQSIGYCLAELGYKWVDELQKPNTVFPFSSGHGCLVRS